MPTACMTTSGGALRSTADQGRVEVTLDSGAALTPALHRPLGLVRSQQLSASSGDFAPSHLPAILEAASSESLATPTASVPLSTEEAEYDCASAPCGSQMGGGYPSPAGLGGAGEEGGAQRSRLASMSAERGADSFVFQPVPLGQKMQCKVVRRKADSPGASLHYDLFLEGSAGSALFLLSAIRCKRGTRSAFAPSSGTAASDCRQGLYQHGKYVISLDRTGSGSFGESVIGAVQSNFIGTQFVVLRASPPGSDAQTAAEGTRRGHLQEQAAVLYETNILGLKGPRRLTLLLPGLDEAGCIRSLGQEGSSLAAPMIKGRPSLLYEAWRAGKLHDIVVMRNKLPQWNEETRSFVLNFHNRVSRASVKNFQAVPDFDLDYIAMQFGRIGPDAFTLDFQYPLSAFQAFAIGLSSLDPKLACE